MPYPNTHMYLTISGDAYNATETWQFGLRLTDGGGSGEATANAVGPTIQDWWSDVNRGFISTHRLTGVKAAQIGLDGKYPPGSISGDWFPANPIPGPAAWSAAQRSIPQLTLCHTLTTAVPRGYASKGRIFLPPQTYGVEADGLIIAQHALTAAQNVRYLILQLNALSLVGNVIVASRGKGEWTVGANGKKVWTYPNPGAQNNVTGVRVGRVMDTQRRRRRSLVEAPQVSDPI